eukprot:Blabericola_migrator_1__8121@NODE_418_length_8690_cov_78_447872_g330_i0_p4_GENE_NODE_418_length_8690_cov_78_447872_g330_i0NODE_418_length_8690_cov_78_447872_g330_i0_p4_ORF_typecomplete_len172_score12_88_NODE_418_length_8690_cov_78_447872_g330_i017182233
MYLNAPSDVRSKNYIFVWIGVQETLPSTPTPTPCSPIQPAFDSYRIGDRIAGPFPRVPLASNSVLIPEPTISPGARKTKALPVPADHKADHFPESSQNALLETVTTPSQMPGRASDKRLVIKADPMPSAERASPIREKKKDFGRMRGRMASMKTPDENIKIENLRVALGLF